MVQIIDEDGVVLAVVDVPVFCSDKFQQFLFFDVKVPQLQFFDRVAEASVPWKFHGCSSWKLLSCPLLCSERCHSCSLSTRWSMSLLCRFRSCSYRQGPHYGGGTGFRRL